MGVPVKVLLFIVNFSIIFPIFVNLIILNFNYQNISIEIFFIITYAKIYYFISIRLTLIFIIEYINNILWFDVSVCNIIDNQIHQY